ncbi:MAG: hypothetical protein ACI8ZB_000279 [Desulforhopalus sp.]|jgi:hypothetical protein
MMKNFNPKRAILLVIIALLFVATDYYKKSNDVSTPTIGNTPVELAYRDKKQSVQVSDTGTVVKLLLDDLDGSRHQKFIVEVSKGLTILIAHNIDLAPKIKNLQAGDKISFSGEYEYNNRGGVVHWTHHDPKKRHQDGWLKHNGKTYK